MVNIYVNGKNMASNNSSDPERSNKNQLKKANRAKIMGQISKGAGIVSLLSLTGLAVSGHFKDNIKNALYLYLLGAFCLFLGDMFQEKHQKIIKNINKHNRQR